jgi:hypothetical protein
MPYVVLRCRLRNAADDTAIYKALGENLGLKGGFSKVPDVSTTWTAKLPGDREHAAKAARTYFELAFKKAKEETDEDDIGYRLHIYVSDTMIEVRRHEG